MAELFLALRALYRKEGGAFPDPILKLTWPYKIPAAPAAEELAKEYNGKALADLPDPKDRPRSCRKAGEQLAGFAQLRDDGTTACGCWIFCGLLDAGRQPDGPARQRRSQRASARRSNWAWSWPANRRILYNRASADPTGKPWNPKRKQVWWNGTAWTGSDVPDFKVDSNPADGMGPFIMNPEGVARFFARDGWPRARSPSTTSRSRRRSAPTR